MEKQKIIIATHSLLYGAPHALRDYLLKKKNCEITFVELPLVNQRKSKITKFVDSKEVNKKSFIRIIHLGLFDILIDFILVFWWGFQEGRDTFVGVDPLNCFAGLILKKIGKVKKVILYSIDFSPIRFENIILNKIYHSLEAFCVENADEVWNVSPRIAEGREKFLCVSSKLYPQKVVPIGVWNEKIKKIPFEKINKHELLFLGHLLEKQGVQEVFKSIPLVIKKIPEFKFIVMGGGEYEKELKSLTQKLKIGKNVEFKGWVKDRSQIDEMLGTMAAAVATYKPEKEKMRNFTYYADPTKIKDYLAAGLPIILTDISYNAKEIAEKKCGILVEYDASDISKAIIKLLGSEKILKEYRQNALYYSKSFDWKLIFDQLSI